MPVFEGMVYSLTVHFQLVTRNVPFPEFTDANVMILVLKGGRPPKPHRFEVPGLTSEVWKIAEMCWHEEPRKRPEVRTILHYLEDLANPGACTHTYLYHKSLHALLLPSHRERAREKESTIKGSFVPENAALRRKEVAWSLNGG